MQIIVTVEQGHLFVSCKFKTKLAPELSLILLYVW